MKTISILGSTGSIGRNALTVINQHRGVFKVKLLVAHNNWQLLASQAKEFMVDHIVILNDDHYLSLKEALSGSNTKVHSGMDTLLELLQGEQDVVLSALMGIVGLRPTYSALGNCKILALANKESLICAGHLINEKARINGTTIIPVDSEHSAIHQVLLDKQMLKTITLTASGGPFKDYTVEQMKIVTRKEALRHPSWQMGEKITIDSATLFNKGLEFIEAMYLFDISPSQIEIVVHPQSIIHSMVTYKDGSTLAQLSRPTMQIPIAYAINFPHRLELDHQPLDLPSLTNMTFFSPDMEKFPLLKLAIEAASAGQAAQIIANCANEYAVAQFLSDRIGFLEIYHIVDKALQSIIPMDINTIDDVFTLQHKTINWCVETNLN